jgi:NADH dehydrogenase
MSKKIVIAGTGFAGVWATLAAARVVAQAGQEEHVDITVVSPEASLHIRPRLYETVFHEMAPDVAELFKAVGVRHVAARVDTIDAEQRQLKITGIDGREDTLSYDRFVLATGSQLFQPDLPGLKEHSFNVDQLASAVALEQHLQALASLPDSAARNTVIVAGGGFTGIETVAEMPQRLRAIFGADAAIRVIALEKSDAIGPTLGAAPRPIIEAALAECGVEIITGAGVAAIDADGILTTTGERIASKTLVWTAGARANPLAAQVGDAHDRFGRIPTDAYLHAEDVQDIFVAGDVALAATDDEGNVAAMSCQHALSLGRVAGHNAAAELLGLAVHPYSQPKYVTCLDLGPWGAIYTEGWDRQVLLTREEGKATKRAINTQWIYPPAAEREAAFATANPDHVIVP